MRVAKGPGKHGDYSHDNTREETQLYLLESGEGL